MDLEVNLTNCQAFKLKIEISQPLAGAFSWALLLYKLLRRNSTEYKPMITKLDKIHPI